MKACYRHANSFVSSCWIYGLLVSNSHSIKPPERTHNAWQTHRTWTSPPIHPYNSSQLHSSPTPTQSIQARMPFLCARMRAGPTVALNAQWYDCEGWVFWLQDPRKCWVEIDAVLIVLRLFGGCRLLYPTFHRLSHSVGDDWFFFVCYTGMRSPDCVISCWADRLSSISQKAPPLFNIDSKMCSNVLLKVLD